MRTPRFSHTLSVAQRIPEPIADLSRIAANLFWTWNHAARHLFREIDRDLWEQVSHNPLELLLRASVQRLEELANDEDFVFRVRAAAKQLDSYIGNPPESRDFPTSSPDEVIAYFCAEFGVSESLPIYSGGLGVLAGDHLKAASDLGLPLVGVGLLYSRGYFRQRITTDGWQIEEYPPSDFHNMPIHLVRTQEGRPLTVRVALADREVVCQIWQAAVGRVKLYLLDSNVLENAPNDQTLTDNLYGGDLELRLCQEIILGVGGIRALRALGKTPVVCHMNEGHAAFLALERIRWVMEDWGMDFSTAQKVVTSANVFTTHTPVPAGFDLFPQVLLQKYTESLIQPLGISFSQFLTLGGGDSDNEGSGFNMALFAMAHANYINGVAKLHAAVSRKMFSFRWPNYPVHEVPIYAVTNGIHTTTWVSEPMAELYDRTMGTGWRENSEAPENWQRVWEADDRAIWNAKLQGRTDLVRFARKRARIALQRRGATPAELLETEALLDPNVLTIGFARRFATYKRATLMLSDRERLKSILFHPERPMQIVIAGKSHPKDDGGKKLIQDLVNFMKHEGGSTRMVFLEDYDMEVARRIVQGVDVWLNNPRRPHEASGTSGMKVVPNGGINCSVLDGWWDEAYSHQVGWAIGDSRDYSDEAQQDWIDSQSLYHLLESEIGPKFYSQNEEGLPSEWISMMKRSITSLSPEFSTMRMVGDYVKSCYGPAWQQYFQLKSLGAEGVSNLVAWKAGIQRSLAAARILSSRIEHGTTAYVGSSLKVCAVVDLGGASPIDVDVQLIWGPAESSREIGETQITSMSPNPDEPGEYTALISLDRTGEIGYSVRIVPKHENVVVPTELGCVVWES